MVTTMHRAVPFQSILTGIAFLACLAGFVWCSVWIDVFAASAAMSWGRFLVLGFLSLPALAFASANRRRWPFGAYCLSALAVLSLWITPWHPRKEFVQDLESVRVGMTIDDVERIMGRYAKGAGRKWGGSDVPSYPVGTDRQRATGTMTYRWNTSDGSYDSDWGQVTFVNGRVAKAEFLPD